MTTPGYQVADAPAQWPVVSSAGEYQGRIISVRTDTIRFPDGNTAVREVVTHPGAVGVVALDESGPAPRVLMIRQYRHPVGPLLRTGRRELLEETGYRAARWDVLVDYFSSPGIITERLRVFLARGPELVPASERDFVPANEEAHLLVDWVPLDDAVRLVLAGELHNGVAVVGILAAHVAARSGFTGLRDADAPEQ